MSWRNILYRAALIYFWFFCIIFALMFIGVVVPNLLFGTSIYTIPIALVLLLVGKSSSKKVEVWRIPTSISLFILSSALVSFASIFCDYGPCPLFPYGLIPAGICAEIGGFCPLILLAAVLIGPIGFVVLSVDEVRQIFGKTIKSLVFFLKKRL